MNSFASNLKLLMKQLALSQASIEKVVDKRQTTISNWINGKTSPDVEDLIKLSDFFMIPIDDLCQTDLAKGNLINETYFEKFKQFGSLKGNEIGKLKAEFHQNIAEVKQALHVENSEEEAALWTVLQVMKQMAESLDRIEKKLDQK